MGHIRNRRITMNVPIGYRLEWFLSLICVQRLIWVLCMNCTLILHW